MDRIGLFCLVEDCAGEDLPCWKQALQLALKHIPDDKLAAFEAEYDQLDDPA